MKINFDNLLLSLCLSALFTTAVKAQTPPFQFIDPYFTTVEIIADSSTGLVGMSFTQDGRMVRRQGNKFYVHNVVADKTVRGTNTIHSAVEHIIAGLPASGLYHGITAGANDHFYVLASDGLYDVDLFGGTATLLPGTAPDPGGVFGLGYHPSGSLVFTRHKSRNDGVIMAYDLASQSLAPIFSTSNFNDDLIILPGGEIIVATLGDIGKFHRITILDWPGSGAARQINQFDAPGGADGLGLALDGSLYSNDKNGAASVHHYEFVGGNYAGAVTNTRVAFGNASTGDLATVGPDGFFLPEPERSGL